MRAARLEVALVRRNVIPIVIERRMMLSMSGAASSTDD